MVIILVVIIVKASKLLNLKTKLELTLSTLCTKSRFLRIFHLPLTSSNLIALHSIPLVPLSTPHDSTKNYSTTIQSSLLEKPTRALGKVLESGMTGPGAAVNTFNPPCLHS